MHVTKKGKCIYFTLPGGSYCLTKEIMGFTTDKPYEKSFILLKNYPNPFNSSTKISYSLPNRELVTLKIYDVLGSKILTLVKEYQTAGPHSPDFIPTGLSSGLYFYTLKLGSSYVETKKMLLLE
jgi:hypothetical protein